MYQNLKPAIFILAISTALGCSLSNRVDESKSVADENSGSYYCSYNDGCTDQSDTGQCDDSIVDDGYCDLECLNHEYRQGNDCRQFIDSHVKCYSSNDGDDHCDKECAYFGFDENDCAGVDISEGVDRLASMVQEYDGSGSGGGSSSGYANENSSAFHMAVAGCTCLPTTICEKIGEAEFYADVYNRGGTGQMRIELASVPLEYVANASIDVFDLAAHGINLDVMTTSGGLEGETVIGIEGVGNGPTDYSSYVVSGERDNFNLQTEINLYEPSTGVIESCEATLNFKRSDEPITSPAPNTYE